MKSKLLFSITLLIFISSCSNYENEEVIINKRPLYTHEFYNGNGDKSDSLIIPQEYYLDLNLENIQGLETNEEIFRLVGRLGIYDNTIDHYIDAEEDTLFSPGQHQIEMISPFNLNENYYQIGFNMPILPEDLNQVDLKRTSLDDLSFNETIASFDLNMFHNWDLRKYPFDTQYIKVRFKSFTDTSLVRLKNIELLEKFRDKRELINENNDLQTGFNIDNISFEEKFEISPDYIFDLKRNGVFSIATYTIEVSRDGSWVFIKLFFGGVLALVISWLVFIIPLRDFSSRIELSIGAVFAAVGNKYFVDSAVDSQVLTVADLFNNIIIFMVVLNVALVIMKRNPVFKNKFINDSKTVSKISIYTALILFTLLSIYTIA